MKTLIAGNWKMNGDNAFAMNLAKDVAKQAQELASSHAELLLCPPFVHLAFVAQVLEGTDVVLGAQDCSEAQKGAFTGDIAPNMLTDLGCAYVIVGHSERRTGHKETSEQVLKKAESAYQAGLKPIICIGETQSEKESGKTKDVLSEQIKDSLPRNAFPRNTVIAYEPVWAIGSGKTPSIEEISDIHDFIQETIRETLALHTEMRILYGGSVKPENAKEILALKNVHGALIGGASLKADSFIGIAKQVR